MTFHINSVSLLDQAPGGLAGTGAERKTVKYWIFRREDEAVT